MDIIDLMASKLQSAESLVKLKVSGSSWAQTVLPQVRESSLDRNFWGDGSTFRQGISA
jgi:hypothetical protein